MTGRLMLCAMTATLVIVAPSQAAEARSECAKPVAPSGAMAPWSSPARAAVARDADGAATLQMGQAADLMLIPASQVRYPAAPGKPVDHALYGGLIGLSVAEAGTYRIALGAPAWVDIVREGAAIASTAHGHGPACTGIRKIVDFPLTPGRYTLTLSASESAHVRVLAARLP